MSTDTARVLVINLNERWADCVVCQEPSFDCGIPMYEDIILPNDWTGEWFGQPACPQCFRLQSLLNKPICFNEFRSIVEGATS